MLNPLPIYRIKGWLESLWETTIILDRYGGTYSGAAWTAWPYPEYQIPEYAQAGDVECRDFWEDHKDFPIGRGNTPNEALADLRQRMEKLLG